MSESIKILFTGDLAGRNRFNQIAENDDIKSFFGDALTPIKESDLAITNLEAPLVNKGKPIDKSGPNIKANPKIAKLIKDAGIGLICLANNHILDFGTDGLNQTIRELEKYEIDYTGVGANDVEACKILYKNVKGKSFAFINIAENEYGNATNNSPGAAPLNPIKNYYQIKEAKENADYVFVIIHGGHETFEFPSLRMRDTYRFFIDSGADAVIGHHTHCFSGHEIYKDKPIVYSLGNFIFDNGSKTISSWNFGAIAELRINNQKIILTLRQISQGLPDRSPAPKFVDQNQQEQFLIESDKKTKIIKNDAALKEEFEKFVDLNRKKYELYMEPTSNKYLLGLVSKGIIKSLRSHKKNKLLLNIIRCEAHRDVLTDVLKNKK